MSRMHCPLSAELKEQGAIAKLHHDARSSPTTSAAVRSLFSRREVVEHLAHSLQSLAPKTRRFNHEDAIQEACRKLLERPPADDRGNLAGAAYRRAYWIILNAHRHEGIEERHTDVLPSPAADQNGDPERCVVRSEARQILAELIGRLTPTEKRRVKEFIDAGDPPVWWRDSEAKAFRRALKHLRRIAPAELVEFYDCLQD